MNKRKTPAINDVEKVTKSLGWVRKVREYLKDFSPDLKSMTVNYKTRDSEINLSVNVPDDLRRKFLSIKIPAYNDFQIVSVLDETFNQVKRAWRLKDDCWKIKADQLPKSERFLVTMNGKLSHYAMQKLVYAKTAANRDKSEDEEKYWLQAIIRDVSLVEKVYSELAIEDVDVRIKIGLDQYYALALPKDIVNRVSVIKDWVSVGRSSRNFGEVYRSWKKFRRQEKKTRLSPDTLISWVNNISSERFLQGFFFVDPPYRLGSVSPGSYGKLGLLENVGVEGRTDLTLKAPKAEGNLTFQKLKYEEKVKESFENL